MDVKNPVKQKKKCNFEKRGENCWNDEIKQVKQDGFQCVNRDHDLG